MFDNEHDCVTLKKILIQLKIRFLRIIKKILEKEKENILAKHFYPHRYFTWDPIKFPTPHDMVANLTAKGRKMVIIVDPHTKREAGYFVHEDCTEKGYYVKDKDGKDYEGDWFYLFPSYFGPLCLLRTVEL